MRFILLLLTVLSALNLPAQGRKGSIYLSGNTSAEYADISSNLEFSVYTPYNMLRRFEGVGVDLPRGGYFISNRLLLGTRIDFRHLSGRAVYGGRNYYSLNLRPFLRYYVLDGAASGTSLFGEVGFGKLGFGEEKRFDSDFYLGAGAERSLAAGVLATANLTYTNDASRLNTTRLTLGLNVLTGQLAEGTADAPLTAGTITTAGPWLGLAYARMGENFGAESDFRALLSPRIGFFVLDGLLLEGELNYAYTRYFKENVNRAWDQDYRLTDLDFGLQSRYYPLQRGRLLPYLGAGISYVRLSRVYDPGDEPRKHYVEAVPWTATAGASYFLSPQLAIDLTADYERAGAKDGGGSLDLGSESTRRLHFAATMRFFLAAGAGAR